MKSGEYIENLSHELLTPLTIIRNEAEILIQSENLSKRDVESVDRILETVNRLSKINKGLILLSKIGKGIFIDREQVNISELVDRLLMQFGNQLELKQLKVSIKREPNCSIETSRILFEILISNALKNATYHNIQEGLLNVAISGDHIMIQNTGKDAQKDVSLLFERFVSGKESEESIGLGLPIMKQICEELNYSLEYQVTEKIHAITIRF